MSKHLFWLILLFLVIGCSEPKLSLIRSDATLLAFGDSLTAGVGATEREAYPAQLERLIGVKVINAGVSGETTQQGLARLPAVLDKHSPQLVILLEGGNDILRNYNLAQTKQNLAKMIEEIQSRDIQLILLGVPEKNILSSSAPLYRELAEQYDLVFDGEIISDLIKTKKYKSDSVHFNGLGYQRLAERIQQLLEDQGALE